MSWWNPFSWDWAKSTIPGPKIFDGTSGDNLFAADGSDRGWRMHGFGGDDTLLGGAHRDSIFGGTGDDTLHGRGSNDYLAGEKGNDTLWGGSGDDWILGGDDVDTLHGGVGRDRLEGGAGDDEMHADDGDDLLFGGSGNDYMRGGDGADRLEGGAGRDYISGGHGDDTLNGGTGIDRFAFLQSGGWDVVEDFLNGTDKLQVDIDGVDEFRDVHVTSVGPDLVLIMGDTAVRLLGTQRVELDASDFIFV